MAGLRPECSGWGSDRVGFSASAGIVPCSTCLTWAGAGQPTSWPFAAINPLMKSISVRRPLSMSCPIEGARISPRSSPAAPSASTSPLCNTTTCAQHRSPLNPRRPYGAPLFSAQASVLVLAGAGHRLQTLSRNSLSARPGGTLAAASLSPRRIHRSCGLWDAATGPVSLH
jgi:hypothetical protein